MDWDRIAAGFEPDDSLRDVYVHGTSLADWQHVLDALRGWTPAPTFTLDGEQAALPETVEEIFQFQKTQKPMLSLLLGGAILNCHFFCAEEIEFDLDPAEVGPTQAEALTTFMRVLGEAANKPVVLTMENSPEAVVFRYRPDEQKVEWVAPPG